MRLRFVMGIMGALTAVLGLSMLAPLVVALIDGDGTALPFIVTIALTFVVGSALFFPNRGFRHEINLREGMFIVAASWAMACLIGALPFWFSGSIHTFTDCFFESTSGFTTTGSTILTTFEHLPRSILFWRSFTHWLGGMGIVVLSIAILPLIGVGGLQLFRAEVPGPTADKIRPRIAETARILWLVYVAFTVAETLLLRWGGMDWFDAFCHTFGTLATGGFSTKHASIGHFNPFIQYVVAVFMMLAGVNFALHYAALRGDWRAFWRDTEFRVYMTVLGGVSAMVFLFLAFQGGGAEESIRHALFQVVSLVTTTGYCTTDYELWPFGAQGLLLLMLFVGGCTGSTGGGIKVMRHTMLIKQAYSELFLLVHPRAVKVPKYGRTVVQQSVMRSIWSFFFIYMGIFGIGTVVMASLGMDLLSAPMAVIACLGNIGPGFGTVGPMDNFAHIAPAGKWFLSLCMVTGRLEVYTVLVLFSPAFWKK